MVHNFIHFLRSTKFDGFAVSYAVINRDAFVITFQPESFDNLLTRRKGGSKYLHLDKIHPVAATFSPSSLVVV